LIVVAVNEPVEGHGHIRLFEGVRELSMKDDGVLFAIAISAAVILGWGWPLIKEYWLIAVAWVAKLMKGAGTDET
jgi:hypothetical protein